MSGIEMKKKIVIVGSGLAGTTIANELSKLFDVNIIERGDTGSYFIPSKQYITRSFGSSPTYCIGEGGTTNLWHNGLIPINPDYIEDVEFKQVLLDSKRYQNESAYCLNYTSDYTRDIEERKNKYINLFEAFEFKHKFDTILIPKCNPKLSVNRDVKIHFNSEIISISQVDGKVRNVQIKNRVTGGVKFLNCDFIIFCSGGIGTPSALSILLGNHRSNGKLVDHPMGFVGKIKVKKQYAKLFKSLVNTDCGHMISRCGLVVDVEGYNHICYFRPAASMSNRLSLYKFKSKLATSSWVDRFKMMFDRKFYHPDILLEIIMHIFGKQFGSRVFSLWFVFEQKPSKSCNSVSNISPDTIDWNISDYELANYSATINKLVKNISFMTEKSNIVECGLESYLWSAAHHSGSVGIGGEFGKVDSDLKLNGFENVYVCDASIINEHSYANTGLTIGQFSIRLSHHLRDLVDL
ncbi:hypothetical protein KW497_19670 [Vibrio fluvialis]|nr:hypothetical protein [Vibrio fluvialis]EKO3423164.1 hypothetical protein [Vibrio fluvialis]EKO3447424.1 hypothetical protein [Vibrio fluvialis]EKO3478769.1 hypothetical protein [Vibrio fluvialis]EKO3523833.1 hypothetical protein [Vibrio fluvialis]